MKMKKIAFITGISGQDGAYLSKFLLDKNYKVIGADRRTSGPSLWRLEKLGIRKNIDIIDCDLLEYSNIDRIVKKYDICIISSDGRREPNLIKEKGIRDIAFSNRKIDKLLHRYISLKNLNIVIALSTNTKEENNYYRNLFGNGIKMIGKTNSLSTYNLVNDCKLSISFMSTMLLETIGLGNKAISIHFDDTDLYFDYPKEIKYVYRDFKSFSKYMDTLLNMSDSDYENKIKNIKKYIMNNDKMNPPHMIIKRHINRIINNI